MASSPITSWQIDGETVETVSDFFWGGAPKSLQMVIAAMKLKDACSLEESYNIHRLHIKKQKHLFADKLIIVKAMLLFFFSSSYIRM